MFTISWQQNVTGVLLLASTNFGINVFYLAWLQKEFTANKPMNTDNQISRPKTQASLVAGYL